MYTTSLNGLHRNLGAVLAAAIVAASGLVFDRAHPVPIPEGIVEIGQLTLIEPAVQIAALPEVVVTAKRA